MPARKPSPQMLEHVDCRVVVCFGGGEQIARHRDGGRGADQAERGDTLGMARGGREGDH